MVKMKIRLLPSLWSFKYETFFIWENNISWYYLFKHCNCLDFFEEKITYLLWELIEGGQTFKRARLFVWYQLPILKLGMATVHWCRWGSSLPCLHTRNIPLGPPININGIYKLHWMPSWAQGPGLWWMMLPRTRAQVGETWQVLPATKDAESSSPSFHSIP